MEIKVTAHDLKEQHKADWLAAILNHIVTQDPEEVLP